MKPRCFTQKSYYTSMMSVIERGIVNESTEDEFHRKKNNDGKHVKPIPPQSQLIVSTRAVTGLLLLERPTPPYKQDVVERMI